MQGVNRTKTMLSHLPSVTESIEETSEAPLQRVRNRSANNVTIDVISKEAGGDDSTSQYADSAVVDRPPSVRWSIGNRTGSSTSALMVNEDALLSVKKNRRIGNDPISSSLSALYAKMIIIIGLALYVTMLLTENKINPTIRPIFRLYLYIVSIAFVIFVYVYHMRRRANPEIPGGGFEFEQKGTVHFGSSYLRIGAILFAIGSIVYDGLELGFFIKKYYLPDPCDHMYIALNAAATIARTLLSIIQMQFLFLNTTEFDMGRHKVICRFGLMHMLATNLNEWLFVLIEETKHDLHHYAEKHAAEMNHTVTTFNSQCNETVLEQLIYNSAPFLFPCTIEYSLICAVVLFEMFKHVKSIPNIERHRRNSIRSRSSLIQTPSNVHHFTVDFSESQRGLFAGILVIVATIICVIMYFVFHKLHAKSLKIMEIATSCEMSLYILMTIAVLVAAFNMRDLKFLQKKDDHHQSTVEMDCTLLIVAQSGVYLYCVFSIIGSFLNAKDDYEVSVEAICNEFLCLFQTAIQTLFILNASWRKCKGALQQRTKPGRQMVTFLLIANMSLWFIYTLIKSVSTFREDHSEFYGQGAWTVITHISMPLAIFYRFHSTVCLIEIWTTVYKAKESIH